MKSSEDRVLEDRAIQDRLAEQAYFPKQAVAGYYSAEMGKDAAEHFVKGGGGGVDDLDNVIYYLLNHFTAADIRQRLKLAAEVHPNEVARAVFGGKDQDKAEANELPERTNNTREPVRPLSKLEEARRLLSP